MFVFYSVNSFQMLLWLLQWFVLLFVWIVHILTLFCLFRKYLLTQIFLINSQNSCYIYLYAFLFRVQVNAFIKSDDAELVLPRCNAFLRLLIYQLIREEFDTKVNIRTRLDNRDRVLVVTKFKSLDDRRVELEKLIEEEEADLENTIGFTKVIKLLIESVSTISISYPKNSVNLQ